MIEKCKCQEDINRILSYIGANYAKALYLFLDAKKYGVQNEEIKSWVLYKNDEIYSVCLKYYTGMHIYAKNEFDDVSEYIGLIKSEKPSVICAENWLIEKLLNRIDGYHFEFGKVARFCKKDMISTTDCIKIADSSDYEKMVDMMMEDDLGNGYSKEILIKQLEERIEDGYSRSYCIYNQDILAAQASTGAEVDDIATIAYVMTHKEYRGRGYAKKLVLTMSCQLEKEGYEIYLIYYSPQVGNIYKAVGYEDVCDIGKMYQDK